MIHQNVNTKMTKKKKKTPADQQEIFKAHKRSLPNPT